MKEWREIHIMVYMSCNECQWENNCEFTCPCEDYTGSEESDNIVDYIVNVFEGMEEYNDIVGEFGTD